MARGDKLGKQVRKASEKKRSAVHKMVEAIIRGDSEAAAEELRSYLQLQTRDLILGEAKDDDSDSDVCEKCGKEPCECDKDDKDSDDDSDKDSDDDDSDKDSDDDKDDKDSDDDKDDKDSDDDMEYEEEEKSKKKKKK